MYKKWFPGKIWRKINGPSFLRYAIIVSPFHVNTDTCKISQAFRTPIFTVYSRCVALNSCTKIRKGYLKNHLGLIFTVQIWYLLI